MVFEKCLYGFMGFFLGEVRRKCIYAYKDVMQGLTVSGNTY